MGLNIIDPNDINFQDSPEYQRQFIYLNLTATRKGRTNFGGQSADTVSVSFLGYDQTAENYGQFTTKYQYLNLDENLINKHEGFGITSVKIDINSSYVPRVTIEFTDIRGAMLFNKGTESPYSILFDFPPPIYELTVKGYYGRGLKYRLHMVRHNSSFDYNTGNHVITADFIAETYGVLSDIPLGYILAEPFMNKDYNVESLENGEFPKNTFELIYKFKALFEKVDKLKNDSEVTKEIDKSEKSIINISTYYEKLNKLTNTSNYGEDKTNPESFEYVVANSLSQDEKLKAIEGLLNKTGELEKDVQTFGNENKDASSLSSVKLNFVISGVVPLEIDGKKETKEQSNTLDSSGIALNNVLIIGYSFGKDVKIKIDFSQLISKLKDLNVSFSDKKKNAEEEITKEAEKITGNIFGSEKPTVGRIFQIICNDIDKFMERINTVGREAESHHESNKAAILKTVGSYENIGLRENTTIYPFPIITSTEANSSGLQAPRVRSKSYIGKVFEGFNPTFPELQFVEDFVDATLKRANAEESFDQADGVNEKTDEAFWIPLNPLLIKEDGTLAEHPYLGLTAPEPYINLFVERVTGLISYIFGLTTTLIKRPDSKTETELFNSLVKLEAENLASAITDEKIISSLSDAEFVKERLTERIEKIKQDNGTGKAIGRLRVTSEEAYDFNFNDAFDKVVEDTTNLESLKKPFNDDDFKEKGELKDFFNTYKSSWDKFLNFLSIDSSSKNNGIINSRGVIYFPDDNRNNDKENNSVKKSDFFGDNNNGIDLALIFLLYYDNEDNSISHTSLEIAKKQFLFYASKQAKARFKSSSVIDTNLITLFFVYFQVFYYTDNSRGIHNILDKDGVEAITSSVRIKTNLRKVFITVFDELKKLKKTLRDKGLTKKSLDTNLLDAIVSVFNDENTAGYELVNKVYKTDEFKTFAEKYINKNVLYFLSTPIPYTEKDKFKENEKVFVFKPITDFTLGFDGVIINAIKSKTKTKGDELLTEKVEKERLFKNADVKQKLYQSFKSLYERWCDGRDISGGFEPFKGGLFNQFKFIDRAYVDIANECFISVKPLLNYQDNPDVPMFSVIASLLSYNSFEFFPLQNFISFEGNEWKETFEVFDNLNGDAISGNPKFTCMYLGGTSSVLKNDLGRYKDDGFSLVQQLPDDFNNGSVNAFKVSYAKPNQSIFKNIQLSTNEHKETNESLKILSSLAKDTSGTTPEPVGQNLFPIYEQRSYTCNVETFGNVMIQPTQYFELVNIPMYLGAYMILEVSHNISPNKMTTNFKGVRIAKFPNPFVRDFAASINVVGNSSSAGDSSYGGGSYDFGSSGGVSIVHPLGDKFVKNYPQQSNWVNDWGSFEKINGVTKEQYITNNGNLLKNGLGQLDRKKYEKSPFGTTYKDKELSTIILNPKVTPNLGISSAFGWRFLGKGTWDYNFHSGIDLVGNPQTCPVLAIADGKVARALPVAQSGGYGNYIEIEHGDGYVSSYAHLSQMDVKTGENVKSGQKLGNVGNTGFSLGNHLHFEIRKDGKAIDPQPFLTGDATLGGTSGGGTTNVVTSPNGFGIFVGNQRFEDFYKNVLSKDKNMPTTARGFKALSGNLNGKNFNSFFIGVQKLVGSLTLNEFVGHLSKVQGEQSLDFKPIPEYGGIFYVFCSLPGFAANPKTSYNGLYSNDCAGEQLYKRGVFKSSADEKKWRPILNRVSPGATGKGGIPLTSRPPNEKYDKTLAVAGKGGTQLVVGIPDDIPEYLLKALEECDFYRYRGRGYNGITFKDTYVRVVAPVIKKFGLSNKPFDQITNAELDSFFNTRYDFAAACYVNYFEVMQPKALPNLKKGDFRKFAASTNANTLYHLELEQRSKYIIDKIQQNGGFKLQIEA